ncbi:hypothetical protein AS026_37940 [Rhizobium altiplani]|uniref:Uncharacterized protein n=1 Tax=Rhizobium altiplani TaxID=1864509 RepID=A0A109JU45_9HYPH|nr:hypothetical protein AS026_37940 [Rhizobium altiplani]
MAVHGSTFKKKPIGAEGWVVMRQRGFEILAPYADAVDRYARKLADDALPRTKGITGKNIYGPTYRELGRILKHSDFNRFREILRNVSAERLPLGPRDNIFGALPTRKWHSIYSASIEYDMSPSMMDRLLRQSSGGELPTVDRLSVRYSWRNSCRSTVPLTMPRRRVRIWLFPCIAGRR